VIDCPSAGVAQRLSLLRLGEDKEGGYKQNTQEIRGNRIMEIKMWWDKCLK